MSLPPAPAAASGLIVAAPASGSGKTLFTLGLLRRLADTGVAVASAKAGPDYIDPAFHARATGRACWNMDTWAMRPDTLAAILRDLGAAADLVVCEGVMGLFDGAAVGPGANAGSTADLARITGWPVVLVVDARAQAASAAAVVRGFATHADDVTIGGVVFNRVGGDRHVDILEQAMNETLPEIPVLGCLPASADLALPDRHLGLVQAVEHPDLESFFSTAAGLIGERIDVDAVRALAAPARFIDAGPERAPLSPLGSRIAVADDAAFAFAYARLLDGWRAAGAEIVPFSPLAGDGPDAETDAVYLPGGYPELHAGRLAACEPFIEGLRAAAARDAVVYGECGGYMMLGDALTDADGNRHAMAGLLPLETSFAERRLHLGYRRAELTSDSALGAAGSAYRGHEFHYASIVAEAAESPLFRIADAEARDLGAAGLRRGAVMGSFVHLIDAEGPGL